MRQKQHILGRQETSWSGFEYKAKSLEQVNFWSILEEFLLLKQHNNFGNSQIYLSAWSEFKEENFGWFIVVGKFLKNIFEKVLIINTPLKYGLTKAFQMLKLIK